MHVHAVFACKLPYGDPPNVQKRAEAASQNRYGGDIMVDQADGDSGDVNTGGCEQIAQFDIESESVNPQQRKERIGQCAVKALEATLSVQIGPPDDEAGHRCK